MTLQERVKSHVEKRRLKMKLVDVQYVTEDRLLVEYTARGRIDFRQLVKDLHREFKCRIEMRQISIREHERRLGAGIVCGRTICLQPFCMTSKWPACYHDRTEDERQEASSGAEEDPESEV